MQRRLVLAILFVTSSCTVLGLGTGAGIGRVAGNTLKGADYGAAIGLMIDIEILKDLHLLDLL